MNNFDKFQKELEQEKVALHGFMIYRNGKLLAKAFEPHFNESSKHRLYSVSKTFTSAAIGCLIGEGKLTLGTKICKFFPEYPDVHPYLAEATVRDLLMMATPFDNQTYSGSDMNWIETFFTEKPSHRAGTIWQYDTSATLVLDAVVQRITGLDFTDYLYDKMLKYIGFTEAPECVRSPDGVSWGGSGVFCTLPELAAFGEVFRCGGKAPDGRQLLPEDYVAEATSEQISNEVYNDFSTFRTKGYGYQIWIGDGCFMFLGMGNQLMICYPEKGVTFVCFGDDQGNGNARENIYRALRNYILDTEDDGILHEYTLSLPMPEGVTESEYMKSFSGKRYNLIENRKNFSAVSLEYDGNKGVLTFNKDGEDKKIPFGIGYWLDGEFPETKYSGMTINTPLGKGYRYTACGRFAENDKLIIRLYVIDRYFGNMTIVISFRHGKPDFRIDGTAEWFLHDYFGFFSAE